MFNFDLFDEDLADDDPEYDEDDIPIGIEV
jgi:hypothetical protein